MNLILCLLVVFNLRILLALTQAIRMSNKIHKSMILYIDACHANRKASYLTTDIIKYVYNYSHPKLKNVMDMTKWKLNHFYDLTYLKQIETGDLFSKLGSVEQ